MIFSAKIKPLIINELGHNKSIDENKKLEIKNHSKIFCCDGMWEGIQLSTKSNLTMSESAVEDATHAIICYNQPGNISLNSNSFNRNEIGIKLLYTGPKPRFPVNFPTFSNNTFSCSSAMNNGNIRSEAGIEIYNGAGAIGTGLKNTFDSQKTGIKLDGCNMKIKLCRFLFNNTAISINNSIVDQTGLGQSILFPTFSGCSYGFSASNSGFTVKENCFKNISLAVYSKETTLSNVTIKNNLFELSSGGNAILDAGIALFHKTSHMDQIISNNFDITGSSFYGIVIPGSYINSALLEIKGNNFTTSQSTEICEVQMGNSSAQVKLLANHIFGQGTSTSSTHGGFHMHGFYDDVEHYCENNSVEVEGATGFPKSFFSQNSKVNFCENHSNGSQIGFEFALDCYDTKLRLSHIGKHDYGVKITSGEIGEQDLFGNCWLPISNYIFAAQSTSSSIDDSRFIVDEIVSCNYPEGSIDPQSLFDPTGSGVNGCIPLPGLLNGWEQRVATNEIAFSISNPTERWNAQRKLQRKLSGNPNLRPGGSAAASFYAEHSYDVLGQFLQAENLWSQAGKPAGVLNRLVVT